MMRSEDLKLTLIRILIVALTILAIYKSSR